MRWVSAGCTGCARGACRVHAGCTLGARRGRDTVGCARVGVCRYQIKKLVVAFSLLFSF